VLPDSTPEPLPAHGPKTENWDRREHPCFRRAQKRFERRHQKSSRILDFSWKGKHGKTFSMTLYVFKRSVPASNDLIKSLEEYNAILDSSDMNSAADHVFMDVGANVGIFALAMALQFPKTKIYAVEPAPQNFRYLLWNIHVNNLTRRIWPLNIALKGPNVGAPEFAMQYSPIFPVSTGYCPGAEEQCEFVEYAAPALGFANLMQHLGLKRISWLKVDCEGCEWGLTHDSAFLDSVLSDIRLLTVEFHVQAAPEGQAPAAVVKVFCPQGFEEQKLLEALATRSHRGEKCTLLGHLDREQQARGIHIAGKR